jgi:hypothetical protein
MAQEGAKKTNGDGNDEGGESKYTEAVQKILNRVGRVGVVVGVRYVRHHQ